MYRAEPQVHPGATRQVAIVVTPAVDDDEKLKDIRWFDVSRLAVLSQTPCMDVPDFSEGQVAEGLHGPADKPLM
jgi:hypothetical protein